MGCIKGVPRGKYKTYTLQLDGLVCCSQCIKRFKRRSSLLQHIRGTHLKIRKICPLCSKKFISTSTLNRHQKSVHGITTKDGTLKAPKDTNLNSSQFPFEADTTFPCLSKVLSLKENEKFGVHVVANNHIDVGEIVVASPPFACIDYLVNTGVGCFNCGKISKVKIQCENCINVWFCSNLCKATKSHRKRCDTNFKSNDCHITRLAIEMIVVAFKAADNIEILLEFCRGVLFSNKEPRKCRPPYSKYGEILKLKGQAEPDHAAIARRVVKFIMKLPKLESFDSSKSEELKRILFYISYHHANTIALNAFSEMITCSKGGAYVQFYIFDALSRFNHSCDPNIELFLDDDNIIYGIATRQIKPGEQLFISYLGDERIECTQERKKYLKEGWNFDCQCQKCVF